MKIVYAGLVLLCALALACANGTKGPTDRKDGKTDLQASQTAGAGVTRSPDRVHDTTAAILSRAEADSLKIRSDSLMEQADVADIRVGAISTVDLIYILVVVLLVVVIIRLL